MRIQRCLLFLLFLPAALADDLYSERLWSGKSGKSFRGTYHRMSADGTKIDVVDQQGKIYQILLANLGDADRALVEKAKAAGGKGDAGKPDETAAFKPTPSLDRTKLPIINQGELGQSQ